MLDLADVDSALAALVKHEKRPFEAVSEVFIEHTLDPVQNLSERALLLVLGQLVGAFLKQPVRFNIVELSCDELLDDFDGNEWVVAPISGDELLYLEILSYPLHGLDLLFVDRDLPMDDLVQDVAELQLTALVGPLYLLDRAVLVQVVNGCVGLP